MFYNGIKKIREGKDISLEFIKDIQGEPITDDREIVHRYNQHFQKLLE